MKIYSKDFKQGEYIPRKFTCDDIDINPEIIIEDIPQNAKSLVLIVDDPDAPTGIWTHWIAWNISPKIKIINQGETPAGAVEGQNDFGMIGWGGPCPPSGRPHRYFFKVFALDRVIDLKTGASRQDLEQAINGYVLDQAEFFGLYKR
ncbi:MAG: YbhB/YbcL family Raf kinase inhibitor-like protein [Patescibacteria group bacterium]|nr:YbhB/YbcL family Raf kinase inhibitor-like protein [Patescibacteria group bacterium]